MKPRWPPCLALVVAVLVAGCAHEDGGSDMGDDGSASTPCGDTSCGGGEVCEGSACHRDCGLKIRCGASEACCEHGDVCYLGACTTPGVPCSDHPPDGGGCGTSSCSDGQVCELALGHCLPKAPTGACEYHPPPDSFAAHIKWEWQGSTVEPTYNQVMMTPAVADLDGDCMPDIVFSTFKDNQYKLDGIVRAIRGDGSGELWSATDAPLRVVPGAQLALADVDGDGHVEVFACKPDGTVVCLYWNGTQKWISTATPCGGVPLDAPSIADLDHDGLPELIVGFSVLDARTGALKHQGPAGVAAQMSTAVELDGDVTNGMEIVGGSSAYHADGTLYWTIAGGGSGMPAIGDLNKDGLPDVVIVSSSTHSWSAYDPAGTLLWGPVDVNNGVATPSGPTGGGPPTIADFDGDGKPDVAVAGGYGYLVLHGDTGSVLWQSTMTVDTSSRVTGSSVFDFDGDGAAEVVYNDEHNLRVFRGLDGSVRLKLCSTSGTLYENPVIVDVDGDNHAEIVVIGNTYNSNLHTCDADEGGGPSHTGIKVIGDAQNRWVTTRRIWNQHTYHVTNINEDGTIPTHELSNWTQPNLNNFRQNIQPSNVVFSAPDLLPSDLRADYSGCGDRITLYATVVNQGAVGVAPGVRVAWYTEGTDGTGTEIGSTLTKTTILAGSSETVSFDWHDPPGGGGARVYVVVADGGIVVNECRSDNNRSPTIPIGCPTVL